MKIILAAGATALALGFALSAASANAAVGVYNFNITTSGYIDDGGTEMAPVDPVNYNFDVTFDPSAAEQFINPPVTFVNPINPAFSGINLSFVAESTLAGDSETTFDLMGQSSGLASIYVRIQFSTTTIVPGNFPFVNPANDMQDYAFYTFDASNIFVSESGDVQITQIAAVPEPATWAIMLVGFGGLGAAMRGRRRAPPAGVAAA